VGHGILKHVVLWALNTNYTYHLKRAIIERAMEYVKDRTEISDDYYLSIKEDCNLKHVYNWIGLFVFMYNTYNTETDG
jgi:hypothetical protein